MISSRPTFYQRSGALVTAVAAIFFSVQAAAQTALDTYVAADDPSYEYDVVSTNVGPGYTSYVIDMKSQTWRDSTEITNQTLWQHYMTIVKPDIVTSTTAFLEIDGGRNGGSSPGSIDSALASVALATGSIVAQLRTVPNQPLQFAGEGFTRSEDAIIAKTFRKFLDGGDSEWPLLLPMVKSAVRAMDTVEAVIANEGGAVDDFFVAGASKRGWTTWLTAAVDDRVAAIAPAVIDVLNITPSMLHHKQHYEGVTTGIGGGFSLAVADYVSEGVMDALGTARLNELFDIVDPFSYVDRLDMPKYLVNSTGDEFFVPDSSQFYFDDLQGDDNYVRYVPNTSHGLNEDAVTGIFSFYNAILQGSTLPEFSWTVAEDGTTIRVETVPGAGYNLAEVKLWQATNPDSRDFRLATVGPIWSASTLSDQGGGQYVGQVAAPASGATALMVELAYNVGGNPITFTTEVSVVPVMVPEPSTLALTMLALVLSLTVRGLFCGSLIGWLR